MNHILLKTTALSFTKNWFLVENQIHIKIITATSTLHTMLKKKLKATIETKQLPIESIKMQN